MPRSNTKAGIESMNTRPADQDRLPNEGGPGAGVREVEASILQWRKRALSYVLWMAAGIGAVPLLLVFVTRPDFAPLTSRLFSLAVLVLILLLALARDLAHPVRAWAFVFAGYAIAGMMFGATGLQGGGRQVLLGVPLYAMVLLGPRSGWGAAAISLALYAGAAILNSMGRIVPVLPSEETTKPEFWLLQGAMLVFALVPAMFILTRFVGFLRGALAAEKRSALQIEAAARERRRLERVLLETADRERRAVGHQLHDGPCQQITAALLRCKVAENALAVRGPDATAEHIHAIAQLLDASVGEIHDLARGLSPAQLSPAAFASALGELARRASASEAVECEFVHDGAARPADRGMSSQLFQIAQEAVNNAVRHAKARHIRVELSHKDDSLRLLVGDDGTGMAPDTAGDGMGLRIMRHRAELMGGSLFIGSAAGGGTLLTCTVPLPSSGVNREGDL